MHGRELRSMKLYSEADWSMINNDASDFEVALMVTEAEAGSDEGLAAGNKEEEDESKDSSENLWGQCPECNDKGPLGLYCMRCEDTGMICL